MGNIISYRCNNCTLPKDNLMVGVGMFLKEEQFPFQCINCNELHSYTKDEQTCNECNELALRPLFKTSTRIISEKENFDHTWKLYNVLQNKSWFKPRIAEYTKIDINQTAICPNCRKFSLKLSFGGLWD